MKKSKKIFWICSYPKSGNTWMRSIISSLFFSNDGKFKFDYLDLIPNFENVKNFEFVKKININDYNKLNDLGIISKYWLESQKKIEIYDDTTFFKTHSAALKINNNEFTNKDNSLGFIYLVRDPRDIIISYAKHQNKKIEDVIKLMSAKTAITFTKKFNNKRYPILLSRWDFHYNSWNKLQIPKLIIKYESLLSDIELNLNRIVEFFYKNYNVKIDNKNEKIKNIINSTNFKTMKEYEKKYGFKEAKKENFFRIGQSGQWKKKLNSNSIEEIEDLFENTMKELNYL